MSDLKLKPCPFCSSQMERHYGFWEHKNGHDTCIAEDLIVRDDEDAAALWNARASLSDDEGE